MPEGQIMGVSPIMKRATGSRLESIAAFLSPIVILTEGAQRETLDRMKT